MLRKFQRQKEKERQKMEKEHQKRAVAAPTMPLCPADAAGGGGSGLTDPLLSLIGSTEDHALMQAASAVDFDIDLVSLLDASEETLVLKTVPESARETQLLQPTDDHNQLNVFAKTQTQSSKSHLQPKALPDQIHLLSEVGLPQAGILPEGLPPALEESIRKLVAVGLVPL